MRVLLICLAGIAPSAFAQTGGLPKFEVASVKPSAQVQSGFGQEKIIVRPGSLIMRNIRLRACIKWAYGVNDYQVSGPAWMGSPGWMGRDLARYEISAKAANDAAEPQLRLMLQALLAERFKLSLHRETKTRQVYALTVAKGGHKLLPSADEDTEARAVAQGDGFGMQNISLARLAEFLSGPLNTPVLDRTNLEGRFSFVLKQPARGGPMEDGDSYWVRGLDEQLGLKLERQKGEIEMLVIDQVEKMPAEN